MDKSFVIGVIGGGAAGFFGAIAATQNGTPNHKVVLLEKHRQLLSKVRISGGGRCNVTHSCFDPKLLIQNYPRGSKELLGPFTRFQPLDTIEWFESKGVKLKTESDGRMFPITDDSETIIQCLMAEAKSNKVEIRTETPVTAVSRLDGRFLLGLRDEEQFFCDKLLIATGSSSKAFEWLKEIGHTIVTPVPSLFTFNIPNCPLLELSGISVPNVKVTLANSSLEQTGPLLITHWGFSGPAILKLSAWGARFLHDVNYEATLVVNWLPKLSQVQLREKLIDCKSLNVSRLITSDCPFDLPRNLWKKFVVMAGISEDLRWAGCSSKHIQALVNQLSGGNYSIKGKSTYKDEFVTCGGVKLQEVNFKTMESRICPGLYFAGEVLDIDGVTGGFNFQSAWTTSWVAGHSIT